MRILVLGAGGPAGVNALRALAAAGHDLVAADDSAPHLVWCEPFAETAVGIPSLAGFDLVLAQPDSLVLWLADQDVPTFQPSQTTILRCQEKAFAANAWHDAGLRSPAYVLQEPWPDHLHIARKNFGVPFWLRAGHGAGARGAIQVGELDQAYHWIRFWQARGADMGWIAEECFPGRDLAWSSIWHRGQLVTSFARERLEYLYPHLTPEGLTGTPTIARVVHDQGLNDIAIAAVGAVDSEPHGIFSVDLREDLDGVPRPTEINAGRGFTTLGLWSLWGPNFLDIAVRAGVGDVDPHPRFDALPEGLTLSRHIDCAAVFTPKAAA